MARGTTPPPKLPPSSRQDDFSFPIPRRDGAQAATQPTHSAWSFPGALPALPSPQVAALQQENTSLRQQHATQGSLLEAQKTEITSLQAQLSTLEQKLEAALDRYLLFPHPPPPHRTWILNPPTAAIKTAQEDFERRLDSRFNSVHQLLTTNHEALNSLRTDLAAFPSIRSLQSLQETVASEQNHPFTLALLTSPPLPDRRNRKPRRRLLLTLIMADRHLLLHLQQPDPPDTPDALVLQETNTAVSLSGNIAHNQVAHHPAPRSVTAILTRRTLTVNLDFPQFTDQLLADLDGVTASIPTTANHPVIDSRLAYLQAAHTSLTNRWNKQPHNRRLRRRIAALAREIETHTTTLARQQWEQLCSGLSNQLGCKQSSHDIVDVVGGFVEFASTPTKGCQDMGDVRLPDYVKKTLSLGPKFATEPKKSAPELISISRRVARAAPNSDEDSLVNECVSVVSRKRPASNHQPVRRVQQFLRDNSLCLLPADKDGGFVVLTGGSDGHIEHTLQRATNVVMDHVHAAGLTCSAAKSALLLIRPPDRRRLKTPHPTTTALIFGPSIDEVHTLVLGPCTDGVVSTCSVACGRPVAFSSVVSSGVYRYLEVGFSANG
ncbi:hypothetical protein HPB52_007747 [Rhipicephalus sanguineus]|uniref:Uncharacterized protein n=1 Tax=Rhipicephalus sanguineus TaxID=34632 RepID=A0A9D4STL4_RHISA|nr:hypothetical protein HPB52_007747 [Rhipicephalus sanguineus]